jgi:hypothetical protein
VSLNKKAQHVAETFLFSLCRELNAELTRRPTLNDELRLRPFLLAYTSRCYQSSLPLSDAQFLNIIKELRTLKEIKQTKKLSRLSSEKKKKIPRKISITDHPINQIFPLLNIFGSIIFTLHSYNPRTKFPPSPPTS